MSERQARIKRKNEPQNEEVKKRSKGSVWMNVVITVIILAFLGLAGYALKDNIKAMLPEKPEKEPTVADLAKNRDISVEEFLSEYGLEGEELTADSTETDVMSKLTVENYAKYTEQTVEELLSSYGIEGVENDMLWQEAYQYIPMGNYAETMGTTFEELKAQAGLPEEITEKTTLKEAEEIMQSLQAEEEAAAEEGEAAEETEEEEPAEEEAEEAEAEEAAE